MTFKQKIIGIVIASLALLGFGTGNIHFGGVENAGARFSDIGTVGTSTSRLLAANTSTQVIATSSSRSFTKISNIASTAIYCNMDGDKAAVAYSGVMIPASSTLDFDEAFAYTGAVRCISPIVTASTTIYAR